MSRQLAEAFFERDLSEPEMDALEASLDASPEAAEAFVAQAEARYRAAGLPEPRWDERRGGRGKGLWLWAALLLLGGGAAMSLRENGPAQSRISEDGQAMPVVELVAVHEAPPVSAAPASKGAAAPAAEAPHRQGRHLGVVLRLREAAPLKVVVADGDGHAFRRLFEGLAPAGEDHYEWDGRDARGQAVPAGDYYIRVQGPGIDQSRRVSLRAAR
jgi:hypothetical protein